MPEQRRRLVASFFRPSRGHLVASVILMLCGLAVTLQVRTLSTEQDFSTLRRSELIAMLDDLNARSRRLETEIASLEGTRQQLQTGADRQQVAQAEADKRRSELAILAGTAPATGPGIRVVIDDPQATVGESLMLGALGELRDAGAEVIEINDSVRVVASTWVGSEGTTLVIDGVRLTRPITLEAIGDPHALSEALRFRGGLVSEISDERVGGQVSIVTESEITIGSVRPVVEPRFARPA